jgi:ribosome-associated toxin RatA of RatAB toxin-antitoxin module
LEPVTTNAQSPGKILHLCQIADSLFDLLRTVHRYPEVIPKVRFCPDRRQLARNSQDGTESELETCLRLFSSEDR